MRSPALHCLRIFALAGWLLAGVSIVGAPQAVAEDTYEQPPIEYSESAPSNTVSRLQAALDRREVKLRNDPQQGYLRDLLEALKIRPESQLLVFSKTSMQRHKISPRTPRAIYFNDEVYIGYCHEAEAIEISVADPKLGAVFYTFDQTQAKPAIVRQTHKCLICHASSRVDSVPSHLVRSLYVDPTGQPIFSEGSHQIDSTSPLEDRWGGWYVSGTHGSQKHLGNFVVRNQSQARPWVNKQGLNLTDLRKHFDADAYLSAHSDIVALMVFEHQTYLHNLLTSANYTARQALHYEAGFNKAVGEPATNRLESTTRRVQTSGEKLVEGLFYVGETVLKEPITGSTAYAEQFARGGPRDAKGRSLRDLDLKTRLFKYPCSYLVYSPAFDELPPLMKAYVSRRIREVLAGNGGEKFKHLSPADRAAIAQILRETKPSLWADVEK